MVSLFDMTLGMILGMAKSYNYENKDFRQRMKVNKILKKIIIIHFRLKKPIVISLLKCSIIGKTGSRLTD
jgi:hypothetical protein